MKTRVWFGGITFSGNWHQRPSFVAREEDQMTSGAVPAPATLSRPRR
jgi:hypothetical protein